MPHSASRIMTTRSQLKLTMLLRMADFGGNSW